MSQYNRTKRRGLDTGMDAGGRKVHFMKGIAYLCIVMAVTQFLLVLGCQSMPSDTRSGHVKELIIRGQLPPEQVRVSVGDEIRWINHGSASLHIVFPMCIIRKIFCRRNFGG